MKIGKDAQAIYQQEAAEQLSLVEELVLELEIKPQDRETLNKLFRVFHTIKGSGSMFGFEAIARFTHHIETILEAVRAGRIPFDKQLADLSLGAKDCISSMLEDPAQHAPEALFLRVRNQADALVTNSGLSPVPAQMSLDPKNAETTQETSDSADKLLSYEIILRLNRTVFIRGLDPLLLLKELRQLGDLKVKLLADEIPPLEKLHPEECTLAWQLQLTTRCDLNAIRDVFIFVEDDSGIEIREITEAEELPNVHLSSFPVRTR